MNFLFKVVLFFAFIGGSGYLAIKYIPSLRADIIETINPRVQETQLISQLQQNLDQLLPLSSAAGAYGSTVSPSPSGTPVSPAAAQAIIQKAQVLAAQINTINNNNSGIVSGGVNSVIDAITSFIGGSGGSSGGSSNSTSSSGGSVTQGTVTPTPSSSAGGLVAPATPTPCTTQ